MTFFNASTGQNIGMTIVSACLLAAPATPADAGHVFDSTAAVNFTIQHVTYMVLAGGAIVFLLHVLLAMAQLAGDLLKMLRAEPRSQVFVVWTVAGEGSDIHHLLLEPAHLRYLLSQSAAHAGA